jgi:hypothetical protein
MISEHLFLSFRILLINLTIFKFHKARRNEEITCDEVVLMLPQIRKYNQVFQRGIGESYDMLSKSESSIFNYYKFFEKVFLPNKNAYKGEPK